MSEVTLKLTAGTGSSTVVDQCQVCGSSKLMSILFLGFLPPVNQMYPIGERPHEQPAYPAELLYCNKCQLAQLGLIVDPNILFAPDYPYTSGTTKILCDNFAELYEDAQKVIKLNKKSLIVDIGSNDGTLLSNFRQGGHRVLGIEPTHAGKLAVDKGIPTVMAFFRQEVVDQVLATHGKAQLITATNVFAHIENIHEILRNILRLLDDDGIFVSESHYFADLVETLQYDTIYHEHLRYYSLHSLKYLLEMHNLEIIRVKRIPTHGGSIRVYAARRGKCIVDQSVSERLRDEERTGLGDELLKSFRQRVVQSKLGLYSLIGEIKARRERIYGIGAPSRASTLVNYVGLDEGLLDYVLETKGSHKIGRYMPGTLIPVVEESILFADQPEYVLLLAWHIGEELASKLKVKGYNGKFIVPLPTPRILNM